MKIKSLFTVIIILFISSCMKDGSDTMVLPDYRESYLPEEIASTWTAAIKCSEEDQDAIELTLTTVTNSENFRATGSGADYNGATIDVNITGTYYKEYNILTAEIEYTFVDAGTFRIDQFSVDLNFYTAGTYLDMIKLDESYPGGYNQSCDTQIKLFY